MVERKYQLELSNEQILFLADLLVSGYCSALRMQFQETLSNGHSFFPPLIQEALRENAHALLREPLRDSRFREELEAYFNKHPNQWVRDFGWEWMQEILEWES